MKGIRRTTTTRTTNMSAVRKALSPAPLALAIALSFNAHAATIVVNSAGTDSEAGQCTIVDAVAAVNNATPVNGCVAGDSNNDTIDLHFFTSPTTIIFSSLAAPQSHALFLTKPVKISAPVDATGAPLVTLTRSTVSGTPSFGLIHLSASATIDGLALTNGASGPYPGGAVLSGGNLTITNSVLSGNSSDSVGGAVASTGQLTVQHSIVSGNTAGNAGGGLYGASGVEVDYSTIKNNSTTAATSSIKGGGGIFGRASVSLLRDDILDNTSASAAGGVYSAFGMNVAQSTISGNMAMAGSGGGLYMNPATTGGSLEVSRSTLNGNTAQGNGGAVLGGTVGLENSTLVGNVASGTGGAVQADLADDQLRDHRPEPVDRRRAAGPASPHRRKSIRRSCMATRRAVLRRTISPAPPRSLVITTSSAPRRP